MTEQDAVRQAARRLRVLRASLGLSQEQLARRLGVSFATVNRWESGRTQLSPRAAQAVADLEAEVAASRPAAAGNSPAPGIRRGQLPLAQTSFIGRDRELAELARIVPERAADQPHRPRRSRQVPARG